MSQTSDSNDTPSISLRKIVDNTATGGGGGGGGGAPTGPAGGVLSGTYPNPGFSTQPVTSVNGESGPSVTLTAADVGATPANSGFSWSDLFTNYRGYVQIRNFISPYKDFDPTGNFCRAWLEGGNVGTDGAIEQVSTGNVLTYDDPLYYLPNTFEPGIGLGGFGGAPWFNNVNFHTEAGYINPTYDGSPSLPLSKIKFPGTSPATTYRFNVNQCSFRSPGYASGYMTKAFTGPTDNASVLVPGVLPDNSSGVKVCMFFHGSGGDDYLSHISSFSGTQFAARDTVLGLMADGWTVISSTGGPITDHWGNPNSWSATQAALAWLKSIVNVGTLVVVGQSMGGLSSLRAAAFYDGVSKWYGIAPCTNLDWLYLNQPAFTASMNTAYGSSDHATFLTASAGCDPMTFAVTEFDGLEMRAAASYSDVTVDRVNNTDALVTRLGAHPASFTVLTSTGGHSDPSNFNSSDILTFLNS